VADAKVGADAKASLGLALVLTLMAVVIDDGTVAWLLAPVILGSTLFAMSRAPLRHSLFGLMLLNLMLENPTDRPSDGLWHSPLFSLGCLMLAHMNQLTGVSLLVFSGSDLLVFALIGIALARRSSGWKLDRAGRVWSPKILRTLAYVSLAGTLYVTLRGLVGGGDMQKAIWQIEKVIYIPALFLLFDAGLRSREDFVTVGKIIIIGAIYKALMACYVMWGVTWKDEPPAYGTSHHDSLLFACAVTLLISLLIHRARANSGRVALCVFPILVAGMIANNRRMVWVQIALVFMTLYFTMPMNSVKRKIKSGLFKASPFVVIYMIVGWFSSGTGIFKPIGTLKSVLQPATDISTMTRDIENYDLAQTLRQNPFVGSGYGVPYLELISLPPMPHPLERWLPHNSLLGLWFAAGYVGYTLMTLLWAAGVYMGVRAYRSAHQKIDRAAALVCFGAVLMYMIQCYGDVGLGSWPAVFTVAPALAIGGKLAVITGAWPTGKRPDGRPEGAIDHGPERRDKRKDQAI
jgi:hypothetical protein